MSFTILKKNPTPGEITSSLTGSTGDGAGLHLENQGNISLANSAAAEFGTADFSIEFVLNQTGDNSSDNYIYLSHTSGNSRIYLYNDISADDLKLVFINSSGSPATYAISHNMANDYNEVTHYVLACDRDGNATLYKNGNSVGTADISGSSSVDIGSSNTGAGSISDATNGYGVLGTFYRFRTWNKLVDAKALFERADVDFADQYGSQTSKILNGTAWTSASGSTPPTSWTAANSATYTIDSASGSGSEPALKIQRSTDSNPYIYQTFSAVVGKQYRVKYRVKNVDATHVRVGIGSSAVGTQYNATDTTATSWQDFEQTYTATTTTFSVYVQVATSTGTQSGYIDSLVVEQVGAVVDLDLAFASPTQSLTVQDRSGAADGTCSASGVTQVQKVVQLNSTSARIGTSAATPADGEVVATSVKAETYRSARTDGDVYIQAATASDFVAIGTQVSSNLLKVTGDGNVDVSDGNLSVNGDATIERFGSYRNLVLRRAQGTSASPTTIANTQTLGKLSFRGYTGSVYREGAAIAGKVSAHVGGDEIPSSLIFYTAADGATSPTVRLEIDNTGLATFSNGIALQTAGSSDTSASGVVPAGYTLSNYEYGAWSPVLFKGATQHTGYAAYGCYVRVGHIVHLSFYFYQAAGSTQTASGTWTVSNLPFNLEEDAVAGYQRIPANYFSLNGANYFNATPHAWQANDPAKITLYGAQSGTDWNSGILEVAGSGVFKLDH